MDPGKFIDYVREQVDTRCSDYFTCNSPDPKLKVYEPVNRKKEVSEDAGLVLVTFDSRRIIDRFFENARTLSWGVNLAVPAESPDSLLGASKLTGYIKIESDPECPTYCSLKLDTTDFRSVTAIKTNSNLRGRKIVQGQLISDALDIVIEEFLRDMQPVR